MRELTGTDVKWLAKGYWDHYFVWRTHPKAKLAAIISGAAAVLFVILLLISAELYPMGVSAMLSTPALLAVLVCGLSLLWTVFIWLKEREAFLDYAQRAWEEQKLLPNRDVVIAFVHRKEDD